MKNKLTGLIVGSTLIISGVAFTDAQIIHTLQGSIDERMAKIAELNKIGIADPAFISKDVIA